MVKQVKGQSPSPIKVKGYKPKKRKSKKKNESIDRMIIQNGTVVSEGLRYHLDRNIPLINNIYRYGSREFFNLINEVRRLEKDGKIDLSPNDKELVETNIGKYVMVNGKEGMVGYTI